MTVNIFESFYLNSTYICKYTRVNLYIQIKNPQQVYFATFSDSCWLESHNTNQDNQEGKGLNPTRSFFQLSCIVMVRQL